MRAMRLADAGQTPALVEENVPQPSPGPGELLVLQPGEHVLVHGGAGAVGSFAVQLARFHGARVTAKAYTGKLKRRRGRGKVVIAVRETR
jgi:NADPH:quinone reductase-like Zn-dependent oxidoreductase